MKTLTKIALFTASMTLMGCQMSSGQMATGTNVMPTNIDSHLSKFGWEWDKDVPKNSWSFNMVDTDARSGDRSQRFELRNGDCTTRSKYKETYWGCENDRERVEMTATRWDVGKDKWIGFSVKVDENDWEKSEKESCTIIFQIRQNEENVDQGNRPQNKTGNYGSGHYIGNHGVIYGVICGNKVGIQVKRTGFEDNKFNGWVDTESKYFASLDAVKGEWNDLVIRWNTVDYKNENSTFELYVNGERVLTEENITSNFFPEEYLFKYGLYRSYMKMNGVVSGTQVIYFDEIRHGKSLESVTPNNKDATD